MKIGVIGSGYVGLVTGTCFSALGNEVWCVDVDRAKIVKLRQGIMPIYEPGLDELAASGLSSGCLHFTTEIQEALEECTVCFIAVGTPPDEDGSADLRYVMEAAREIGTYMKRHMYVVNKSTAPVGTAEKIRLSVQSELDRRGSKLTFDVISNPEFLREGSAIADCMKPDRIIVGTECTESAEIMRELYKPYLESEDRLLFMDVPSAEMTKYAANAMLALRISFINEIANICERVGADVNAVRSGIGRDPRIGSAFINPGCGYGGICFSKDVDALTKTAESVGYAAELISAIEHVNKRQKNALVEKVIRRFGEDLHGRVFSVWGLSFKPNTDDMRGSPAITIIQNLTAAGAEIRAYDPKAAEAAQKFWLRDNGHVTYCGDKYEALRGADALLLVTEWKEFRSPDFCEIRKLLKTPLILDGRNQYDARRVQEHGICYEQIGVRPTEP